MAINNDHMRTAIEKAGGIVKLGKLLGIKHTSMYRWIHVPANRVLDFERISGIPRETLRPDVFGPAKASKR